MGIPTPVEELAWLVKDNLYAKHLVLSVEELFVEFLECPLSEEETLALEPMVSYQRMLLHRLADLFGLAHESVGEGEERHLVVEKCEESLIPAVLVSDVLEHNDGEAHHPQSSRQLLKRHASPTDGLQGQALVNTPGLSLEERQAAYLAARQRIFSEKWKHADENSKESGHARPRSDPVVARRMIAHALGKPKLLAVTSPSIEVITPQDLVIQFGERTTDGTPSPTLGKLTSEETKEAMQQSSVKAAKRMFANALGLPPSGSSARFPSRQVPCRIAVNPVVNLVEESTFSPLPTSESGRPLSPGGLNMPTGGVQIMENTAVISPHNDEAFCESVHKAFKSPTMAQVRPSRNARPGVAACRIFAQALGLPDPVCSSEVSRSPSHHRGGSLASG
ncbi:hypothetical protein Mapa_000861 [Marchantia paleacea]|nr:hypothetical protein Mapa_000861 [Marchantia paleacea]